MGRLTVSTYDYNIVHVNTAKQNTNNIQIIVFGGGELVSNERYHLFPSRTFHCDWSASRQRPKKPSVRGRNQRFIPHICVYTLHKNSLSIVTQSRSSFFFIRLLRFYCTHSSSSFCFQYCVWLRSEIVCCEFVVFDRTTSVFSISFELCSRFVDFHQKVLPLFGHNVFVSDAVIAVILSKFLINYRPCRTFYFV